VLGLKLEVALGLKLGLLLGLGPGLLCSRFRVGMRSDWDVS
jgi:hypothetical protein